MAAPPRPAAPAIQRAAPAIQRSAPTVQRAVPAARAAERAQRVQQRQEMRSQRQQAVQPQQTVRSRAAAPASTAATQSVPSNRVQQLQSQRRLSGVERRELRTLQRTERQNARQNIQTGAPTQSAAQTTQQQRIDQLQSQRRLSRTQQRELRSLQRAERQNAQQNPLSTGTTPAASQTAQQQRIQQLQSQRRLNPAERRELRQLQRDERQNARQQQQQNQPAVAGAGSATPRALRTQAVSAQQVAAGRFASAQALNASNANGRRAGRRAALLAARTAWQLGLLAPYVPWRGPVYWPYAYNDVFYYTFWPDAYDPGYWAYAYDDFFDGMFFPDGAPYVEYAGEGPYVGPYATGTTGSASARSATPGRLIQATRDFCADQAKGVTSWPLEKIADAVQPNAEQRQLLDDLRKASEQAASQFKEACPDNVPMTPPGRLAAMIQRLQATDQAIQTVKPALDAFYNSLSDEQKARFNEVGPQLARQAGQRTAAKPEAAANCSSEKAGLSNLAVNRIEQTVRPNDAQGAALDKLDAALEKAVDILRDACPNTTPMTPVGRLEVMQKRIEALLAAANEVRPALEEFYASLSDEQKAKFNRLGRQTAQSGE
jgi:hypothetical protein